MTLITQLAQLHSERSEEMEAWFSTQRHAHPPMLTTSVDLRHSGYKLVPVDANIYPAGFQNLTQNARMRAASGFAQAIHAACPGAKKVLIFPEAHTRNLPYLDNLLSLEAIIQLAGFDVQIASLTHNEDAPLTLQTANGQPLNQYAVVKQQGLLQTKQGFVADVILLNNDCTSGVPELLKGISQPVLPTPCMGWFQRKKSAHFKVYAELATHFALTMGIDPWQLYAFFDDAQGINFKSSIGVDMLAHKVDNLITKIRHKYHEYGITDDPYVYVKADSGTYGMGIMQVRDGSELLDLNKKQRNKMHVIKEGAQVDDVILQEGVPTIDTAEGKAAEPMIYMVDGMPIGGMFRVNSMRDARENLNAAGMEYESMCDISEDIPGAHKIESCNFAAYGIIAAISALAVGAEQQIMRNNAGPQLDAQCVSS